MKKSDAEYCTIKGFLVMLAMVTLSCTGRSNAEDSRISLKFEQYYVQGESLYKTHCIQCHQKNGEGFMKIYPPINHSNYMENNFEKVICLIKYGISEEIIVNKQKYNQSMPGVSQLTALDIAELATYIYNRGNHKKGLIETKTVDSILKYCAYNQ